MEVPGNGSEHTVVSLTPDEHAELVEVLSRT